MDSLLKKALPYYFFGLLRVGRAFGRAPVAEPRFIGYFRTGFRLHAALVVKHNELTYLALNLMIAEGLVEVIRDDFADTFIKFSAPEPEIGLISQKFASLGSPHDVAWLQSAYEKICKTVTDDAIRVAFQELSKDGPEQLAGQAEQSALLQSQEEDTWRPLPIDRSSTLYEDAISATDAALEIIEGNNGYAQTEPEERNAIVETIKGNIKAIKEGTPSLAAIKAGLIAPLQFLAKKFADAAIGIAAKVAIEKLLPWLAHLF